MNREILYRLERHKHGWLVHQGTCPGISVESFQEICRLSPDAHMSPGIAGALKAFMAIGLIDDIRKWEAEINAKVDEDQSLSPAQRWLHKTDVGVAALTIFIALIGNRALENEAEYYYLHPFNPDVPHDPSDFGRCQRLLDLTPAWEEELSKVAIRFPETMWIRLIPRWQELKKLYREEEWVELAKTLNAIYGSK